MVQLLAKVPSILTSNVDHRHSWLPGHVMDQLLDDVAPIQITTDKVVREDWMIVIEARDK